MSNTIRIGDEFINLNAVKIISFKKGIVVLDTTDITIGEYDNNPNLTILAKFLSLEYKEILELLEYKEPIEESKKTLTLLEGLKVLQDLFEPETPNFKILKNRIGRLERGRHIKDLNMDLVGLKINLSEYLELGWIPFKPITDTTTALEEFDIDPFSCIDTKDKTKLNKVCTTVFCGFKTKDVDIKPVVGLYTLRH